MNSHVMFQMEEDDAMDLWDPSTAAFLWSTSSGEESNESLPPPMWANVHATHQATANWNIIDEDTVLFADYSHVAVDELYDGGVLVDSCVTSSNNSRLDGEEEEEEDAHHQHFGGDHEEQVHFFDSPNATAVDEASYYFKLHKADPCFQLDAPEAKTQAEVQSRPAVAIVEQNDEKKKEIQIGVGVPISHLSVKIEATRGFTISDSVLSTPDVVNDVMTLEDEGLFRNIIGLATEQTPIKIEEDCLLEVADEHDYYEEFLVEFPEDTHSELSQEFSTNPPSVAATVDESKEQHTEFEDDDKDEDYKPPVSKSEKMHLRTRKRNGGVRDGHVKKRGRPAKPIRTHLTPRELANLEPEAKKHKEQRFKNNEASRLSRFKRRQKDLSLQQQCDCFASENDDLRRMLKAHKRLHKRFRSLMIGGDA